MSEWQPIETAPKDGSIWCNLYVNAHNSLENASICPSRREDKTMKGAQNWAAKMLGL